MALIVVTNVMLIWSKRISLQKGAAVCRENDRLHGLLWSEKEGNGKNNTYNG